jgi:hypothetical protein
MWVHFDDFSINLSIATQIAPGPDGQIVVTYPNSTPIVFDGEKSKAIRQALAAAPVLGNQMAVWESWLTKNS